MVNDIINNEIFTSFTNIREDENYPFFLHFHNQCLLANNILEAEKSFELVEENLKIIYNHFNLKYGAQSVMMSKGYYHTYSYLFKRKFDLDYLLLTQATVFDSIQDVEKLSNGKMFIHISYEKPLFFLKKALFYINEAINIKHIDDSTDIEITYTNRIALYVDMIKLKTLFGWKVSHLSEKFGLDFDDQIKNFQSIINIDKVANQMSNDIEYLVDNLSKGHNHLLMTLINVTDSLANISRARIIALKYYHLLRDNIDISNKNNEKLLEFVDRMIEEISKASIDLKDEG